MKKFLALAATFAIVGASTALSQSMEISTSDARKSAAGAAANFTGKVAVAPMFPAGNHTQTGGGHVTFDPGARSAWHTHPAGQTLIVTTGTGWVQEEGQEKKEVKVGDVIWTPPGVKHWHGAKNDAGMSHLAVTEVVDGKNVDWMEQVTDEQYLD
jgi:quercetin dioxygenase-like cupin family protein